MNLRICFIRPSRILKLVSISQKPAAPLGLAYLASVTSKAGHDVSVVDAAGMAPDQYTPFKDDIVVNGLSISEAIAKIPGQTDIIGLSCMFSGNWLWDREFLIAVRNEHPQALIIAGGEHITAVSEYCMEDCPALDLCVLGEGEQKLLNVIDAYIHKSGYDEIEDVVTRSQNKPKVTEEAKNPKSNIKRRIQKLDQIPIPDWSFFPIDNYQIANSANGVFRTRSLPVMASRGCPYSCTFCSSPNMWGTKYNLRKPEELVNEIEYVHNTYNIGNFDFFDLTAIIKREWIIEFAKEILRRELKITWQIPGGTRAEAIDEEVAYYLNASGCSNITYAPESGSDRLLKIIRKKVSLQSMIDSIKASSKQGLSIKLNMIVGLPDETHKDIWKTMWFLVRCSWNGVDDMFPANFTPYPGSSIFKDLVAEGKIKMNDDYFDMIVYSYTYTFKDVYSKNLGKNWLRFYGLFLLFLFYSTSFLFKPKKVVRLIKSLFSGKYETRMEVILGEMLRSRFKMSKE